MQIITDYCAMRNASDSLWYTHVKCMQDLFSVDKIVYLSFLYYLLFQYPTFSYIMSHHLSLTFASTW